MLKKLKKLLVITIAASSVLLSSLPCLADYPIFYQRYTADPAGLEYNGRIYQDIK
jgi:arabinoxylan arabinofuranohydrolase